MTPEERRARDREYWQKNKAKRNAQKRGNYRANMRDPESREKRLASQREWKKEVQYPRDREDHIRKVSEWKNSNPEKVSEYQRKTNSRRKYDESLYEYHRIIVEIENTIRG